MALTLWYLFEWSPKKVSQANYDPDFDLAEGSHQVVLTLLYLFGLSPKRNHKQSILIYTEFTYKSETIEVIGSEPNTLAKEMWFTSYRKNEPIKLEFIVYHNICVLLLFCVDYYTKWIRMEPVFNRSIRPVFSSNSSVLFSFGMKTCLI